MNKYEKLEKDYRKLIENLNISWGLYTHYARPTTPKLPIIKKTKIK